MNAFDGQWMERALQLAELGRGHVEPNPLVGAVVVRENRVIGEGWHQRFGEAHAEVNALAEAGVLARDATMYVTLEPCCHHGKTPPCTDAILRAGIRRVVAAMWDPFPQVAGHGAAVLKAAGVELALGVGENAARRLNAPYLKLLATSRPYVHAKWAMTLDGKIATRTGHSHWISGEAARQRVHELRGRMDAIVVGIGNVLADDPVLTARPPGPRTPGRIVLDTLARLPAASRLALTARETPVIVAAAAPVAPERAADLTAWGCECLELPPDNGRPAVTALLDELGRRRMSNILVEGGSEVLGSFLDAGEVDEVYVFVSPRLVGGTMATPAVGGRGVQRLEEALNLADWHAEVLESDVLIHGWKGPG
jgi:diaminohydroxyphosphoribosylaminopyrimidine deaminase/5-amino-6-(5-phosphoribosylamino)uracil reductase